jgi:spore germination protein YaaH
MHKKIGLKRIIIIILIPTLLLLPLFTILTLFSYTAFANEDITTYSRFSDVPENHWAFKAIHHLRSLKITNGIGNNQFGLGLTIKRSEFVAFLAKLMKWELISPEKGSFADNMDTTKWYYAFVETALKYGTILKDAEDFRPDEPTTREEMAIMIVRTLGYDTLANQLTYLDNPFDDVYKNTEYITIARDFGIIKGVGNNSFKPFATAKREEAAAMMMRMYEKLNYPINELHAFYAIRSAHQVEMFSSLDSVGFGWSRLEYDYDTNEVILNTTRKYDNEYAIPDGFSSPLNWAKENNVSTQLMVYANNDELVNIETEASIPLLEYVLTNSEIRKQVISSIVQHVNNTIKNDISVSFDGVVIDFEGMKGELLRQSFNEFLSELRQGLDKSNDNSSNMINGKGNDNSSNTTNNSISNKLLYVTVHPKMQPGQEYFDGYDYRTIGEVADKVILMAHDYYAKKLNNTEMESGYTITPLSPINEIYYALKSITDIDTGVQDLNKIWLQISYDSVQWKLKDGKVINSYPYSPDYESIRQRLLTDVTMNYSNLYRNPYISFFDDRDETHNVLWYEDSRSVEAKIKLAKMFGIKGISLWRLGNIPDYEEADTAKKIYMDVWQKVIDQL